MSLMGVSRDMQFQLYNIWFVYVDKMTQMRTLVYISEGVTKVFFKLI